MWFFFLDNSLKRFSKRCEQKTNIKSGNFTQAG
jgi:hypothetical protein